MPLCIIQAYLLRSFGGGERRNEDTCTVYWTVPSCCWWMGQLMYLADPPRHPPGTLHHTGIAAPHSPAQHTQLCRIPSTSAVVLSPSLSCMETTGTLVPLPPPQAQEARRQERIMTQKWALKDEAAQFEEVTAALTTHVGMKAACRIMEAVPKLRDRPAPLVATSAKALVAVLGPERLVTGALQKRRMRQLLIYPSGELQQAVDLLVAAFGADEVCVHCLARVRECLGVACSS